ncbi:MAG: DUF349 domain-containing protein [Bacteroidales bacterium]|nr:DUF349 domain-containing protein [Bacteroidales bacterium]
MEDLKESIINPETSNVEVNNNAETFFSADETQKLNSVETEELSNQAPEAENEDSLVEKYEEPTVDYSAYTREQLVDALKELVENESILRIKNRVASIKLAFTALNKVFQNEQFEAFLANGGNKDEYHPSDDQISVNYRKYINKYRENRQKYQEEQESIKLKNLALKKEILEDLRTLIEADDTLKQTHEDFKVLQTKWKSIGEVPRAEINNLWQTYHFLVEKFFNKVKINRELRMLDLKRNLEQKIELCEKVEELLVDASVIDSFKKLQQYREQWRTIGPVPSDKNEEIWVRFCNATEQIDQRRRDFYDQRKEELDKNLLAKTALCEKAEELTAVQPEKINVWNEISNELNDMLKVWKTIGPVPKDVNESIWERFKSTLDKFFETKKEHFEKLKDEQANNYNLKVDLCMQAEAIAKRDDWKKATDDLLKLQEEWKQIGSVPRKVSDKIWTRFRSACDEFFARKAEYYSEIKGSEMENLAKKREIIEKVKQFEFGEDKEKNLAVIKEFQREWVEIGHVPIAEKDKLYKEFRDTINKHFDKLKVSAREAQETMYRERLKNVSGGDMGKFVSEEKRELQDKIQKLKADLILWENNLGFLANSKQANILKEEFEKKMQSARQQIALLEAKLKILNEEVNAKKENEKQE